jgi:hypothetical protein
VRDVSWLRSPGDNLLDDAVLLNKEHYKHSHV